MSDNLPVNDSYLNAYIDGQLNLAQNQKIEQALKSDEASHKAFEDYKEINSRLHAIYDPVLEENIPARFLPEAKRPTLFMAISVYALLFLVGGLFGWQAQLQMTQLKPMEVNLVQQAVFAHAIYSTEVEHSGVLMAKEHGQLNSWLSRRLKTPLTAPNLNAMGYRLIGGRLLPSTQNRMAAQYMYENTDGARMSLYVRRGSWKTFQPIHHQQRNGYAMFYWSDKNLGYALTSDLPGAHQQTLAKEAYRQMSADSA